MKLTGKEARDVIYGDSDDWEEVTGTVLIVDKSRWSIQKEGVFLHKPSKKHYEFYWQVGATEMQDEQPFEYDKEVEPVEVELKEVIIQKWMPVSQTFCLVR
jgi:hypothetical protein